MWFRNYTSMSVFRKRQRVCFTWIYQHLWSPCHRPSSFGSSNGVTLSNNRFPWTSGICTQNVKTITASGKRQKKTNIRNEQTKISDADSHRTDIFTGLLIWVKQSPFTGFFNFKNNRCDRFGILWLQYKFRILRSEEPASVQSLFPPF